MEKNFGYVKKDTKKEKKRKEKEKVLSLSTPVIYY
jgi:hypothetical protein